MVAHQFVGIWKFPVCLRSNSFLCGVITHLSTLNIQLWGIMDVHMNDMMIFVMPYSTVAPLCATVDVECSLICK
jgi:hypothetical protein